MHSKENLSSEYSQYFVNEVDYNNPGVFAKLKAAGTVLYSIEAKEKITSLLQNHKPDIAHFHIFQHQISPSVFAPLQQKKIPLILTLHDLKPICPNYKMFTNGHVCEQCKGRKFYKCFVNTCNKVSKVKSLISTIEMYLHYMLGYYQSVDRYIAVSQFYQRKMIEFGFPEDKISYLPNYIDTSSIPLSTKDDGYVLYFGRLSEEKGVETLIKAAQLCKEIKFKIAGTGPEEQSLQAMVERNNTGNIEFTGFKTGNDLNELIARSSFTVITSKWYENCPMSVLESLAYGKPVIGANIGGIPELIVDGNDGYIYSPDDHEDLAQKIKTLWDKGSDRLDMGSRGRKKVEDKFNPELHYQQLIKIYNEVQK